jgi:hypothetical protein
MDVRESLQAVIDAVRTAHRILRNHEFYSVFKKISISHQEKCIRAKARRKAA